MTYQNQTPPASGEMFVDRLEYEGPKPRPFAVWFVEVAWCSACLVDWIPIVRFGNADRCAGLCRACLTRLVDAWATPLPGVTNDPESPDDSPRVLRWRCLT